MMSEIKSIIKYWGNEGSCIFNPNDYHTFHWAFYNFADMKDGQYWREEHKDNINKVFWQQYTFMSIPCAYCGVYSPLRCSNQFSSELSKLSSEKKDIINYRSGSDLSNDLAYYNENGWTYIYFRETLSDSLCGQETFRLRHEPI